MRLEKDRESRGGCGPRLLRLQLHQDQSQPIRPVTPAAIAGVIRSVWAVEDLGRMDRVGTGVRKSGVADKIRL